MQINSPQIASGRLLRRHHHVDLPLPAPRAAHHGTRNEFRDASGCQSQCGDEPHSNARVGPTGYRRQSTGARDCQLARIIDLSHAVERGVGLLLPDELDVALAIWQASA
jgi:hypothetical protein